MKFGVGQPVRRFEDVRLITGRGRFQDDIVLPRQAYAVFLRSPHAHARIVSIDVEAARAAPGVLAVYTGADYKADRLSMPKAVMPRRKADGSPMFAPQRPALVMDRVRYVGDPVAMVIADSLADAKDAAELIAVAYEELPSVTSTAEAARPDAARVWDENPDNISHTVQHGNRAATDAAFAQAAHVVRQRYIITRVHAQYMEPRGAIGSYDAFENRYTLYADVNYPHRVQHACELGIQCTREQCAGGLPRCRWWFWRQGLAICRTPSNAVGGAQARTTGQVDVRALGSDPRRRACAR